MEGTVLNVRRFAEMLEPILAEDAPLRGRYRHLELCRHLTLFIENDVHEQILLSGKTVVVHAIIIGGLDPDGDLERLLRACRPRSASSSG